VEHDREPSISPQEPIDRYRRLIEGSDVGLFQTTPVGEIRWVNRAAARIVGYESPEEFTAAVGDIRQIYVDPSRRDDFLREIAAHGEISGFEYEISRRDGAVRWIEVSARPVIAPDGSVELFEGTVTDVTNKRLLRAGLDAVSSQLEPREAVSRFADVLGRVVPFHQLTLSVIEGDHYRRMISVSAPDQPVWFPPGERVPLAENPMLQVVTTRSYLVVPDTAAGQWAFDAVLLSRGVGSYAVFPLVDESGVFATFNVGVAEPSSLSEDVVTLLESITSAVANAVKNILVFEREREARRQLAEAIRLKDEFLERASHDLRSPVTIIDGLAEILQVHWDAMDDDLRRQRLQVIQRQARRMKELVRRDMDVALIEAGDLVCQPRVFDLAAGVREAVQDVAVATPSHRFEVSTSPTLPMAYADDERTLQVLANLVTNAVKFSPRGTAIRVGVSQEGSTLRVDVQDEGPGIDPEHRDEIFEKMARLDPHAEGTGLGLYIARSLVELQGGRIWAASAPGAGARLSFTVPVAH
jgi:PAS domain S-box-containing protein